MIPPEAARIRVLVVDDDEDASVLLGIVLGRQGFTTKFATDLPEAQRALDTGDFAAS